MTMLDQNSEAPKPKKRRKAAKKRASARAAPPAPKPAGVFVGISPSDCPDACTAECCVISGRGICSHPYKGGLQANMQTPEALRRLSEAKRTIGKRKLEIADE